MPEDRALKKSKSSLMVVILTAITTLLVAGGGAYMLGYLGPGENGKIVENVSANTTGQQTERKIAYWRAPMVPTEIYDQPGKSAMGMDLVPVYEDEITDPPDGEETERKIAYWRAPMNPTEIYDTPGKSAMGMDLVPVYEDEVIGGVEINIDPVTQQNMGVRLGRVEKAILSKSIRTFGTITYDETGLYSVNTKFNGWIEALYVDFVGERVEKGQPLGMRPFSHFHGLLPTAVPPAFLARQFFRGVLRVVDDQVGARQDVSHLTDRRILVGVDRQNELRFLHPRQVLDGAGDAAGDVDRGRDGLAGLPHLHLVFDPARVHHRPGGADGGGGFRVDNGSNVVTMTDSIVFGNVRQIERLVSSR